MPEPTRFAFVLVPRFSMLALAAAIDALRAANVVASRALYDWVLITPGGGEVRASCGLALATCDLPDVGPIQRVAVCGGERSHDWSSAELTAWLHRQRQRSTPLGALSDGSFVLAEAGLFDDVPSTIHWKCQDAYRERFPRLDVRASVFELGPRRFSCAGGTAALDLFLHMIQREHGPSVAEAVADNYIHDHIRDPDSAQKLGAYYHLLRRSPEVATAVQRMERHIEDPLPLSVIARGCQVSSRQLVRLFHQHVGETPSRYYLRLRLTHARQLLAQTTMKVSDIAIATGFSSSAHLAGHFHQVFGTSPSRYRRQLAGPWPNGRTPL